MNTFYDNLAHQLEETLDGTVQRNEKLAHHVTYCIGGPAALFVECASTSDVSKAIGLLEAHQVPWTVIGKGSNLLVSDKGYQGAVITLQGHFNRLELDEESKVMVAGAGVALSTAVLAAYKANLYGFEFAAGIPGTVGGALAGNVGTATDWISSRVTWVTVYDQEKGLQKLYGEEIPWRYRRSGLGQKVVILEAQFHLEAGDREKLHARMEGNRIRRRASQPTDQFSAGSIFRNPPQGSAGKLIDACGLKGARIGGAQISEVHANFIVNVDHATAQDVVDLVVLARSKVEEAYGIQLVPEIHFLGFEE